MATENNKEANPQTKLVQQYIDQAGVHMVFPFDWTKEEKYLSLSGRARQLYMYLWSRKIITLYHGCKGDLKYFDLNGDPFVVCKREETAKYLDVCGTTITKCFQKLESAGLIFDDDKPRNCNHIYVNALIENDFELYLKAGKLEKYNEPSKQKKVAKEKLSVKDKPKSKQKEVKPKDKTVMLDDDGELIPRAGKRVADIIGKKRERKRGY